MTPDRGFLALMRLVPVLVLAGNALTPAAAALDQPAVVVPPPPASPTPTPQPSTLQLPAPDAALRAAVTDPAIRRFYEANGWQPVWSDSALAALKRSLTGRARHGLDHIIFLTRADVEAGNTAREIAQTRSALRYAAALAQGVTDPAALHRIYTIPRPSGDLGPALAQALAQGRLETWFDSLAPADTDYARLSAAYLKARHATALDDQASGAAPVITADESAAPIVIHVGDTNSRVPAIAAQLVDDEYLAPGTPVTAPFDPLALPADPTLYNRHIADAIERLQRDYGIAADGIIGAETLAVLNLQPGDRAQALAVALERLRWLTRAPPATRIDVNTAAAQLNYYRDGVLVDTRRVITGKPGKNTPQLQAPLFRLVANPTWTIPKSIQNSEMSRVGPAYLRRHNMVRRNSWIVQLSGPSNALGLVKFDMQDDYAIYLHDTSAPSLFERSQRHLSHGCVRVFDALGFAQMLADDAGITDAWAKARQSRNPQYVPLPQAIPVRLLYQNVFVDADGRVAFRTDPYGWNAPIAVALGFEKVARAQAKAEAGAITP